MLIAISGYGRDDDRGRAEAAGFDVYVVKPARPEEVADLIGKLAKPGGCDMPILQEIDGWRTGRR